MTYYHGTQAASLKPNSLIEPGHPPHSYTLDPQGLVFFADNTDFACFWGCAWGSDEGLVYESCHVYEVEPTGPFTDDRGVQTRQVPPGNFQSTHPLRIIREVT
jgi:hypothetical protein